MPDKLKRLLFIANNGRNWKKKDMPQHLFFKPERKYTLSFALCIIF